MQFKSLLDNLFPTLFTAYIRVGVLRMTSRDGGNAIGLSGTILAHAPAAYDHHGWWKCRKCRERFSTSPSLDIKSPHMGAFYVHG